MLSLVLRSLLIVLCLTLAGCGGEPSSPASPSSPSPTGPAPLVTLSTGTPSAELLVATNAPAATYRLSLEYILDNETDTHVVTAESPVTSKVPPLPLMTGLTITSPVLPSPPGTRLSKPVTFSAAGAGGRLPYEYQWSAGNIVLRDWSTDPRFLWDGVVNGYPQTNATIIVRARGAGGAAPEVVNQLSVFLN